MAFRPMCLAGLLSALGRLRLAKMNENIKVFTKSDIYINFSLLTSVQWNFLFPILAVHFLSSSGQVV